MRVLAEYARKSICTCGFPVLADQVPLGTAYVIHPENRTTATFICGGCGAVIRCAVVFVERRADSASGYLPADIFEIVK